MIEWPILVPTKLENATRAVRIAIVSVALVSVMQQATHQAGLRCHFCQIGRRASASFSDIGFRASYFAVLQLHRHAKQ